ALERMQPLLATLARLAKAHDATSAQIALAWVVSHPNVIAIPGASSVAQLESNAASADIELSPEELAELEAASDLYRESAGNRALRALRTRIGI
nr:aldo/keto reductase [Actinomycetota bacterium]